jgi:hypothetical protein
MEEFFHIAVLTAPPANIVAQTTHHHLIAVKMDRTVDTVVQTDHNILTVGSQKNKKHDCDDLMHK